MGNKIEVKAASDREILIMVVDKLNDICDTTKQTHKAVYGNGVPGLKTQVLLIWLVIALMVFDGKEALHNMFRMVIK